VQRSGDHADIVAGANADFALGDNDAVRHTRARVEADIASSRASGVRFTPTFYINRWRYDGPWDESSLVDAMLVTLGHRVRTAAWLRELGPLGVHFAGPRDRGRDRHHELSARASVRGALAPGARFELGRQPFGGRSFIGSTTAS
jgi:hypothetical protein